MSYGVVRGIKQGNEACSPENTVCLPRMEPSYVPEGSAERWEVTKHKVVLEESGDSSTRWKSQVQGSKGDSAHGKWIETRTEPGPQWPGGWR